MPGRSGRVSLSPVAMSTVAAVTVAVRVAVESGRFDPEADRSSRLHALHDRELMFRAG